jgi:hypothetical protein
MKWCTTHQHPTGIGRCSVFCLPLAISALRPLALSDKIKFLFSADMAGYAPGRASASSSATTASAAT